MIIKCKKKETDHWWSHEVPHWFSDSDAYKWGRYRQRLLLGHAPVNYEYKLIK